MKVMEEYYKEQNIKESKTTKIKTTENKKHTAHTLVQIYFYLTAGCNLACKHCWLDPKFQDETKTYPVLPIERFESILEQAKPLGLSALKLTGGEPLMHPQIHDILKILQKQDLSVSVETNGVLCTPRLAEEIAACKNNFVSVSLDGVDAQTHEKVRGIKGCFSATAKGIKNLLSAGIRPQIIMSIMPHNKHQLEALLRLAEFLGAHSVKFNIVNPVGRGEKLRRAGETLSLEELLTLGQWVWETLVPTTKMKIHFALPVAFRNLSDMFGKNGDGCEKCGVLNMMGVLANGDYALCGIGAQIPELVFGNASVDRLQDIWDNNHVLKELREGIPSRFEGICGNCLMRNACTAYCIAQNYYSTGSLWKSYWFCEEAYKKGIFPKSRIAPRPSGGSPRALPGAELL